MISLMGEDTRHRSRDCRLWLPPTWYRCHALSTLSNLRSLSVPARFHSITKPVSSTSYSSVHTSRHFRYCENSGAQSSVFAVPRRYSNSKSHIRTLLPFETSVRRASPRSSPGRTYYHYTTSKSRYRSAYERNMALGLVYHVQIIHV
jgi:hypothetical protein